MNVHVEVKGQIQTILQAAGVRHKNSTATLAEFRGPVSVNSYWDGGSRQEYALVDLATLKSWAVPTSHPYYDRKPNGQAMGNLEVGELPAGVVLVEGGTFCGSDTHARILARPDDLTPMLPAPESDPAPEGTLAAVAIVATIKGGYRADRFTANGLGTYGAENPHVVDAIERGYLKANKAGAVRVTVDGRNASTQAQKTLRY